MITPELVARINELARKKRKEGLTEEEKGEQAALRHAYLDGIREQMTSILESIEFVDVKEDCASQKIINFQNEMNRPFIDKDHVH